MRWSWKKKSIQEKTPQEEISLREQRAFISSLYSINVSEINSMKEIIKNHNFSLSEIALISNLIFYFQPLLTLEVEKLRILFSYIIFEFVEETEIYVPLLAMQKMDKRIHLLNKYKRILLETFENIFIPKTSEKTSQYLEKIIENYMEHYSQF